MEKIEFIGEHLLPGQVGNILIVLSFVFSLLAVFSYYKAEKNAENISDALAWKSLGRLSFFIHGFSILGIMGTILYVMANQMYEYNYVFQHVSDTLPMRFILSAFWEGQEGSFLLWMFWHVILGFILIFSTKDWENRVMTSVAAVQAVLGTMILGIVINWGSGFIKIGANPLLLTREVNNFPILSNADYLSILTGSGLNPLLQNYWMTIHPPTLFLGFALCTVPFAFAIGALWKNDYKSFLHVTLPWGLLAAAILGAGIIMGAAWAYEALNFGGYWAWDPVENMSLVPWLVLLAGIHTNLIGKSTGYSVKTTLWAYIFSFILVLYSTFLTRSGVLGDSSVHAFTQMGLEWQLVILIFLFLIPSVVLYFSRRNSIPVPPVEEQTYSKEFWIFIGSLTLLFSAIIITFSTSIPVYNKILDGIGILLNKSMGSWHRTVPLDPINHYNKNQLWVGILIGIMAGFSIFLRFRERHWKSVKTRFFLHTVICAIIAFALTFFTREEFGITAWQYYLLSFTSFFIIVTNINYIFSFLRTNLKLAGSALSHIGFGLLILGALASGLRKHHISTNPFAMSGLVGDITDEDLEKYIFLIKNQQMFMSGYMVTYNTDTLERNFKTYTFDFNKIDENGNTLDSFKVHPVIVYDNSFSKVAAVNPSTKRYINRDIFTTIASLPPELMDIEKMHEKEDTLRYREHFLNSGDVISIKNYTISLEEIIENTFSHPEYTPEEGDIALGLSLRVISEARKVDKTVTPGLVLRAGLLYHYPVEVHELGCKIKINEKSLDKIIIPDQAVDYDMFFLERGEISDWNNYKIGIHSVNAEPSSTSYIKKEGDIALEAELQVLDKQDREIDLLHPVFFIRGNQALHSREISDKTGIIVKLINIDTKNNKFQLLIGQKPATDGSFVLDIAENFDRADYVVLEAIVFPWISLVWIGCTLMTIGLSLAMFMRIQQLNQLKKAG